MSGNAAEWCADWHAKARPTAPGTDPAGPAKGEKRVVKGGNWRSQPAMCRIAARMAFRPETRREFLGLRVARSADR